MPKAGTADRKDIYCNKLKELLSTYQHIFIVHADNVGSNQMQQIRIKLRGLAVILMGKNTMIRRVIREEFKGSDLERLTNVMKGNVGFVFCKEDDMTEVRTIIKENKVPAAARAGLVAPCDVVVPAGGTGLEPSFTSFFQALGIATKINRGAIEIVQQVSLIEEGTKVGSSEATLLGKLNIKPFTYGLVIKHVYDNGNIYDPSILDITNEDLVEKFRIGVYNIAAIGLAIGYPTLASIPHSIVNCYKNILAVSVATEYTFEGSEKIKEILANPEAFAAAAAAAAPAATASAAKVEEPEEESDDEMGLDLFG